MLTHSISLQTLGLARVALSKNNYQKRLLALMSTKPEFINLKNLTLLTELEFFGVIYLMNKKILGIIAGSVAALGSAVVAAPAHAQTATLPVTVTVQPRLILRTYSELNFSVNQQELLGGSPVDTTAGPYNEGGVITALSPTAPGAGTRTDTVTKTIPVLYQVWGGSNSTVNVTASVPTLTATGATTGGGDFNTPTTSTSTATMSVATGATTKTNATNAPFTGGVGLAFKFNGDNPMNGARYTGGRLTITVVSGT